MKALFDVLVGLAVIAGTIFAGFILYYSAASYYGWKPAEGGLRSMAPLDWKFAILVILGIVILLSSWGLLAVRLGWIGSAYQVETAQFPKWPDPYKPVAIVDKRFVNERVLLDGNSYFNCDFTNVTFVYNGTTAIQLNSSAIHGRIQFASDTQAVNGTFLMLYALRALRPDMEFKFPPGMQIQPANMRPDQNAPPSTP